MKTNDRFFLRLIRRLSVAAGFALLLCSTNMQTWAVTLATQPVFATSAVPGNLALPLSVEYPTAVSVANLGDYADATQYVGYFDPNKCYTYQYNSTTPSQSYFQPASLATGTNLHSCTGQWSGNFMNWATMQTIDPFRWALTGGYRSVDTTTQTILEKAWASGQGGLGNAPMRGTGQPPGNKLPTSLVSSVTPFTWGNFNLSIEGRGNTMAFTGACATSGSACINTKASPAVNISTGTATNVDGSTNSVTTINTTSKANELYQVYVRVDVCDPTTTLGTGGLEANCVQYGTNYKPEGLLQQYANRIRYSAFSYLNGDGNYQQGGVMRAPMGFIGPTYPTPLSSTVTPNPTAEWSSTTGIMSANPDTTTASGSGVSQSGVMNYLNKFGETAHTYMQDDNVSELYYAVVRYFENLGNVPEWLNRTNPGTTPTTAALDGFPAVVTWTDPIQYACQKNFVLGIGDDHTHYDANVGGGTLARQGANPTVPAKVASDTFNKAHTYTTDILTQEGISTSDKYFAAAGTGNATYYIAGLAYQAHINDIRPDLAGTQTLSTYWMDVGEYQRYEDKNQYWLATKYGGFSVPTPYDPTNTSTPLTTSWFDTGSNPTSPATINMNGTTELLPDNYFQAGNAGLMVANLKNAFASIANAVKAYTTSFSLSSAQVSSTGAASYASQYDSNGWTGVLSASNITFAADGTPTSTAAWSSANTLETQLAGTGWSTKRNVVTWNNSATAGAGIPFEVANLTSSGELAALTTTFTPSNTTNYLKYLRGDRTNETNSTATGSTHAYRARSLLLGDIVDSKVTPVGPPNSGFSDAVNPGYAAFQTQWTTTTPRPTMVYVGANDGMLHAFNGALTGATAGTEQFAYIPGALLSQSAGGNGLGLAQLGNPNYVHQYYVDATPLAFDIDFNNAGGNFITTSDSNADWHTVLIGGLGAGGNSFYAIDVTDPANMNNETTAASKVLWEFTDPTMGNSFGAPVVIKTHKYGWVVVLTSGYNNSDGYGYIYFVNPKTGALLEKVKTPSSAPGLTQATAYVLDYTDGTADAIYAGDLNGQLWRFDVTEAKGATAPYPAPVLLATLTDGSGTAQPVTTQPLVEIQPTSKQRFVLVGTGQLLASTDITSSAPQTFYSILDGNASGFSTITTPITRANLMSVADPTQGIALTTGKLGWYVDLGVDSTSNIAWRLVSNPVAYNGTVAFAPLLTNGNACSPSGQSRIYALNIGTGKSILAPGSLAFVSSTNAITDLAFVSVNGITRLLSGDNTGGLQNVPISPLSSASARLLNWREVPTVN